MTTDDPVSDVERVSRSLADLWQSLTHDDTGTLRPPDTRKALFDQVRTALDRGEARLDGNENGIVANSFTLLDQVHTGTATRIYRARHRDLDTLHAIKTLNPDHADDPVARRLLLREGEIGLGLRHPHIVATQTVLRLADGRPALVFEWCGGRLSDRLVENPPALPEIVGLMKSLLSALDTVHRSGVVHCDLSPSNLLFDEDDQAAIRLADFGIALRMGERHGDLDLAFAGQPDFSAPEHRAGQVLDGRADLYAAGRLLHLLLSRIDGDDDALQTIADTLSAENPARRPDNAKAALRMLDGLEDR